MFSPADILSDSSPIRLGSLMSATSFSHTLLYQTSTAINQLLALYPRQLGQPAPHLSETLIDHKFLTCIPNLPYQTSRSTLGSNTKQNPEETAERNTENPNPYLLYTRLILGLMRPLVSWWSPLSHTSHCTTTSWSAAATETEVTVSPDRHPRVPRLPQFSLFLACRPAQNMLACIPREYTHYITLQNYRNNKTNITSYALKCIQTFK